ncbi:MAG: hypothetical protein J6A38_02825 [Clostridia bacterium]|nr:hypothetical protein [Clostridia bacterium]
MELYEHVGRFTVKFCDADFKDDLKISTLLALLEEVACASAEELGFGYAFVKPKGYAFMVTNIACEIYHLPVIGEKITLKTWPTPPSHVIFGREYQMLSESNEVLVNASSRWCLIDRKTEKLLQSKVLDNQDYSTYNQTKVLQNVRWKIPAFSKEEGELRFSITIANSEYDHNFHVNNTRYADYALNCFSVAELSKKKLEKFSISYVKQCKEGETLSFYRKQTGGGEYCTQGFNERGELVVQANLLFSETLGGEV